MRGAQGVLPRGLLAGALLILSLPLAAAAQSPFLIEVRGGLHQTMGSAGTEGVAPGSELRRAPAFGVSFALQRGADGYLVVGFSQYRSRCEGAACARRVTTQWEAGWRQDLAPGPVVPWVRAGVVVPKAERIWTPDGVVDSGTGIGGEIGVGIRVNLAGRVHLAPGVRAGWGQVPVDGRDDALPLRWALGELALILTF